MIPRFPGTSPILSVKKANAACPCFPELQALFVRAFSFGDQLREVLKPLPIRSAFVYGHAMWGESCEPIELVVIGGVEPTTLDLALRPLEIRLGRLIAAALLTEADFAERLQSADYFLQSTLRSAHLNVIGDDFAAAA